MNRLFGNVSVWIGLVSAAIFILNNAAPCFALDRPESFWNKQPCGWKEVEGEKSAIPEKIWNGVDELINKCKSRGQDGFSTIQADGRIFTYRISNYRINSRYQVRSIIIRRGGETVYYDNEKICP